MLYLVPTPIGNLSDITLRALEVLREVDIIVCENPRHSQILLKHYQISKPVWQLNQHSLDSSIQKVIANLTSGRNIAYLSDAGTPGISDPGHELVRAARAVNQKFTVLPGANAVLPAAVGSGLISKDFYFGGFLPQKKGRQKLLTFLLTLPFPIVVYESPYRISKLLQELVILGAGEREVVLVKELSKIYEEYISGFAAELATKYADQQWKGEYVVVINEAQGSRKISS